MLNNQRTQNQLLQSSGLAWKWPTQSTFSNAYQSLKEMLEEFQAWQTPKYEQDCKTNQILHCISAAGTPKSTKIMYKHQD